MKVSELIKTWDNETLLQYHADRVKTASEAMGHRKAQTNDFCAGLALAEIRRRGLEPLSYDQGVFNGSTGTSCA